MKSHNGDRTYSFLQKEQYTNQVLMLILPLNLGQTCKEGNFISVKVIYFSFSVSKQENNVLICELAFLLLTSSRGRPLYLKQRLNLYKIKFLQVFIGKLISLLNYLNNKLTFKNILFQSLSFCGNFSTFSSQFIFWLEKLCICEESWFYLGAAGAVALLYLIPLSISATGHSP